MNAPYRQSIQPRGEGTAAVQVAAIARRYCEHIEAAGPGTPAWLQEVALILPRLHAAMTCCGEVGFLVLSPHQADLDARFELFTRLRRLLGDRDGYFLEFDRAHDGPEGLTGSLADDLTDIYCELQAGLCLFDESPERALGTWFHAYVDHWQQHLIDAERHLAALAAAGRLVPPRMPG